MIKEKFTINYLPEPAEVGEKRSELPLHLTIVPPVNGAYSPSVHFDFVTERFEPIDIKTTNLDFFDANQEVRLTNTPERFMELRDMMVRHAIGLHGATQWANRPFCPHFSIKNEDDLAGNLEFKIDQLSVWTKKSNGHWWLRQILELGQEALTPDEIEKLC
jgi:2'-5' RNA ligase